MAKLAALLGLLQHDANEWFHGQRKDAEINEAEIEELILARSEARKARDFARADVHEDAFDDHKEDDQEDEDADKHRQRGSNLEVFHGGVSLSNNSESDWRQSIPLGWVGSTFEVTLRSRERAFQNEAGA